MLWWGNDHGAARNSVRVIIFFLMLAGDPAFCAPCDDAEQFLRAFVSQEEGNRLAFKLKEQQEKLAPSGLSSFYCTQIIENLHEKARAKREGAHISAELLEKRTIGYEQFKLETYLTSGVSPKRYFGFLDEEGDTAAYERLLRETVARAVAVINDTLARGGSKLSLSDKEVTLTFLAEGGALLMTSGIAGINRVHPVYGIGLDDFKHGFKRYPELVSTFDRLFGTRLGRITISVAGKEILLRPMTFREAVLGTALMYLYEKEIAEKRYRAARARELSNLGLDEQFVVTSLVYNSGILFSDERIVQILGFDTSAYLQETNKKTARIRPRLPIYSPHEAVKRLSTRAAYPRQLTSWSAVYHVLQRYGAWVALTRFTTVFDERGRFYSLTLVRVGPLKGAYAH